ncbi:toxin-antitoxin system YwqK family antitoxin [Sphingobacterium corticibacter]|uniref:Toxin-antitoxin system YwqK family antitoxin n=1 Tax=Sphingobacterium corticibacter TaxID=2171749 RepID=A0A2T8HJ27_9SPHI|nr:hypothetical protein [Sphingobacterium corticibacter]PVH25403.1 hypothetical protein DC487_10855 [Sphingobacterium corticibacter]
MIDGKKQGEWKVYYLNGQLKSLENYTNDTLDGKVFYYGPNGILRSKASYKMGVAVDSFIMYHTNGNINLAEWRDDRGKSQGVFRVYYDSGQLSQIGTKKDGHFEDTCRTFYKNGKPREMKVYQNNLRNGIWVYYNEDGEVVQTEAYENDVLLEKLSQ